MLFSSLASYAQTQKHYYVVIGAFAIESNAIKFSGFAKSRFFQATYELHPRSKLFYVYVIKTAVRKEAIDQVLILQKEPTFSDSWVFRGVLGSTPEVIPTPEVITPPVIEPDTVIVTEQPLVDSVAVADSVLIPPIVAEVKPPVKGKLFKFVITSPSGELVDGSVHHVDLKRGRDLASYKSNETIDVLRPTERVDPMSIICGIFGYKEVTQFVDFSNPSLTTGAVQDAEGTWVIPFKLERLKKGDVSVMYDVSFYKDAVIMLPRSQEELDELFNMMQSNPNYKVKIHGHSNGSEKDKRRIVTLGKTNNYFDIKGSDHRNGNSKDLSKWRAEAVRQYLMDHGIAKDKMEIMAWGGTNMLVGEASPSAKLNDRIEIEILED